MAYLLVDERAQTSLALDDGIRDAHLAAQGRQEDDELNGVDIVGDEDERRLLVLDETDDVVEAVLDHVRLLADVLLLLALLDGRRLLEQALLLLLGSLRLVLGEELEGLGRRVAVKNVLELRDRRRHLQAHAQDLLLALQPHVLGPFHHARQIPSRLDILANAEVATPLLEERVLFATGQQDSETRGFVRLREHGRTLGAFLPARLCGNGAGATFFPLLGGCH